MTYRPIYLCATLLLLLSISSCSKKIKNISKVPSVKENAAKPKYLWFDAEANFERFSNRDTIKYYLDKTKTAGFTNIIVDVRPIHGKVLYKKTSLPELNKVNNFERTIDWDYLQFFIDQAKLRNLKVTVSTTIFPAGDPVKQQGLVYEDHTWNGKTSILNAQSGGLKDIRNDKSKVAAFLNPALPEVQDYALKFIKEIVTNYDVDGYALDYCRFSNVESDFSEETRKLFENYIGEKVTNFPSDIFTWEKNGQSYERKDGKYAKQWFEFRSKIIHDFIKKVKVEIKAIKPTIALEYWAASWHHVLYQNGQNWASKSYDPSLEYSWASKGYKNTGFAEHLDAFIIGTYLSQIYGINDPESIEYGLAKGKKLIAGDTKMYGSIYALTHKKDIEDAAYVSLTQSDGLMVFDIVQVIQFNQWDALKRGIDRAEK
jgi:uncharacterized lipoprotein YddW (UPF0748 family)